MNSTVNVIIATKVIEQEDGGVLCCFNEVWFLTSEDSDIYAPCLVSLKKSLARLGTMLAKHPDIFTCSGRVTAAMSLVHLDRVPKTLPPKQRVSNRTEW